MPHANGVCGHPNRGYVCERCNGCLVPFVFVRRDGGSLMAMAIYNPANTVISTMNRNAGGRRYVRSCVSSCRFRKMDMVLIRSLGWEKQRVKWDQRKRGDERAMWGPGQNGWCSANLNRVAEALHSCLYCLRGRGLRISIGFHGRLQPLSIVPAVKNRSAKT